MRFWHGPRHFAGGTARPSPVTGAGIVPRHQPHGMHFMTALWVIVGAGLLAVVYGVWAIRSVMASDAGSQKMQEISAAVREGAQAYLKRQYTTIGIVGVVIFAIAGIQIGRASCR